MIDVYLNIDNGKLGEKRSSNEIEAKKKRVANEKRTPFITCARKKFSIGRKRVCCENRIVNQDELNIAAFNRQRSNYRRSREVL